MSSRKKNKLEARKWARRTLIELLRKEGVDFPQAPKTEVLADMAERLAEVTLPRTGKFSSPKARLLYLACKLKGVSPPFVPGGMNKDAMKPNKIKAFYKCYEWRAARYDALQRNDGRCDLCGRSKHDGVQLNVDHIKPLRFNWALRTDPANLQVLCGACNHGKGNRDETDWREPHLATLMGEAVGE